MPFLVRKKSPKRTSNPLSFGPQIRNIGQGSARDIPKKEASREFIVWRPKDSRLQMKPAFLSLLLVIRSSPCVACMALQKNSAQLRPQIRYLWTSLPSKSPQIRYSGTKIGRILGPQIRYFWTRNGLSFPGPMSTLVKVRPNCFKTSWTWGLTDVWRSR